jgi:hypothetical protein
LIEEFLFDVAIVIEVPRNVLGTVFRIRTVTTIVAVKVLIGTHGHLNVAQREDTGSPVAATLPSACSDEAY